MRAAEAGGGDRSAAYASMMAEAPASPPFPIAPMKGVADRLPDGQDWVYELKWDGMRALAHLVDGRVRLQSTNGRDVTVSYPELGALAELADGYSGLVLDGEIVAFADGRPSFNALQQRMHVSDPSDAARRVRYTPVLYVIFDLVWLDGHDTTALALRDRRALLERIVEPGDHWRICEQHSDGAADLLEVVIATDLEGIMAKRAGSTYQLGRRSPDWVKVKPRHRQEFVVGGWLTGRNSRAGRLGSLLLGYYDAGELVFAGRAGSGLTDATLSEWEAILSPTESPPFSELPPVTLEGRTLHWCVPEHVVEIAYNDWPPGHQLRHPVVLGRRSDKHPTEVTREG